MKYTQLLKLAGLYEMIAKQVARKNSLNAAAKQLTGNSNYLKAWKEGIPFTKITSTAKNLNKGLITKTAPKQKSLLSRLAQEKKLPLKVW